MAGVSDPIFLNETLPSIPDAMGVAGPFAGVCGDTIIVAGGANFPKGLPWEGGKKVWHNEIYTYRRGSNRWTTAALHLPQPMAYGVSVSIPDGVLCIGGDNASQTFSDVFLLKWDGARILVENYPPLPVPLAYGAGVLSGNQVYVVGGSSSASATSATKTFLVMDLKHRNAGWKSLESWPGRPRILPVVTAMKDSLFLCSGADLAAGPDNKPKRTYLKDAWCYSPDSGWKQIADLPRPVVAAPSPCPSLNSEFYIMGGDDGSAAGTKPSLDHPGFARTTLCYHINTDSWSERASMALPPVTTPMVKWVGGFVIPSGEIRPGVRSPDVHFIRFKP